MKDRVWLEVELFLLSVDFLTRLPVPSGLPQSDDLDVRARKYQPAVGALVGLVAAFVLWLAAAVLPYAAAVILGVGTTIMVTGAFHEDGLADAADGLGASKDRDQTLRIMNDARLGTFGALALGLTLALKVVLLSALPPLLAGLALVSAGAVSKMAVVHVMATNVPAHRVGLRARMPSITTDGYRIALAVALAMLVPVMIVAGAGAGLALFLGAVALAQAFRAYFIRRIGGYTGDGLGGAQQMAELGAYLGLSLWL